MILEQDADTIALVHLDRRTGARAVEAPAINRLPGRNLSLHRFGDEPKHLHAIVHCEWQVLNVRGDHRHPCRSVGTTRCVRSILTEQPRRVAQSRGRSNLSLYKTTP